MPRQSSAWLAPFSFFAPDYPTARSSPRPGRVGFYIVAARAVA